ncbi:MAG: alpha-galactosidase [Gammaproteobacteria bacterium]
MKNTATHSFYTLHSNDCSLVLDCSGDLPAICYWGPRLSDATGPEELAVLAAREEAPAREHVEAPIALTPMSASGYLGHPGLLMHRNGVQWNGYSVVLRVDEREHSLVVQSECAGTDVELVHTLSLDPDSNVLKATTTLTNRHDQPLVVDECNAPCIPIPDFCTEILGFAGRWSGEFRLQSQTRSQGSYVRENRSGRTSHDAFPGVITHDSYTSQQSGTAYGFHLGWSGNHRVAVDELADGRVCAQLGELFYPGEMILTEGESYTSPALYATCATQGLNQLSQNYHRYVRSHLTAPMMKQKDKLVHFNSWEAVYFDLSESKLLDLVAAAAEVGAERFVLDDGWFRHRRSDKAGLGDWYVEEKLFPNGLHPLAECIAEHGLEFGLWLEPEMVNPDSDLYRAHPDWALQASPAPNVLARHQLVLDLTNPDVQSYLFERIDALLGEYPVTYIKWDMNRDLHQPGNAQGVVVVHAQTRALYALLERIRKAHPTVEIESCSSGGGRADFGILEHTDRIWTSDSNDALDRLFIQRGFSLFFPAEFMGSHVGPADCHITGRRLTMALRGATAMFGDMGVEANLLEMGDEEKTELAAAIELHKQHRRLIFSGDLVRLNRPDYENAFGIVSANRKEALFSYTLLRSQPHSLPGRLRLAGLDENKTYTLRIIWPDPPTKRPESILSRLEGAKFSGASLMQAGIQLPLIFPESPLVIHLAQA